MRAQPIIVAALLLGACGSRQTDDDNQMSRPQPVSRAAAPTSATTQPSQPTNTLLNAPPTHDSLAGPRGSIDPKSAEAAGQVVQHYGALIEQKRWSEAERLWGNGSAADAFAREIKADRDVHLEIGPLGGPEGAAGSIYVTMPVAFYGIDRGGKPFRRPADIVLRRVNDVPGSTEAQRRWHIERIEWKLAA
jgi:hypothetical protein